MKGKCWCFCGMICTSAFISVLSAVRFSHLCGTRFGNHMSFCHFQKFGFQPSMVEQNIEEEKGGGGGGESEFIVLPNFLKWFACILKHLQKWLNL